MRLIFIPMAVAATLLLGVVASGVAQAQSRSVKTRARLTPEIVALARKWAKARGLPLDWVLATIAIESGGRPSSVRTTDREDSLGLMQINWRVHGPRLLSMGIAREALLNPDTNIMFGTLYLREIYDQVRKALALRDSSVPVDVLVRLAYNLGPAAVLRAISEGRDIRVPEKEVAWQQALARTSGLV
jgi:soluble lytic murein transglycosylase-like protein